MASGLSSQIIRLLSLALIPVAAASTLETRQAADPQCNRGRLPDLNNLLPGVTVSYGNPVWLTAGQSGIGGVIGTGVPARCYIPVNVKNTQAPTNDHNFGLALPAKTFWEANNKRFLAAGNGAYIPLIQFNEMLAGLALGFAVVSTDTGHASDLFAGDMRWASNPGKLLDWTSRAMDQAVILSKIITQTYYQTSINFSYYAGYSTGGRQGLMQVQESPDNFDGVLVGAPAWDHEHLAPWVGKVGSYQLPASNSNDHRLNTTDHFILLHEHALEKCDLIPGLDDVQDRTISRPDECLARLNLTEIQCEQGETTGPSCLTPEQVDIARKMYADYKIGDKFIFDGLLPGSELGWGAFTQNDTASNFDVQYQTWFLNQDDPLNPPIGNWSIYEDNIALISERQDPGGASADNFAGMTRFRNSSGKLLMYQGLGDATVPSKSARRFYNRTKEELGGGDVGDFFRYFEIPGMQHCWNARSGGESGLPWYFGAPGQHATAISDGHATSWVPPTEYNTAEKSALMALVGWVEGARPPTRLVATSFQQGSMTRFAERVVCLFRAASCA